MGMGAFHHVARLSAALLLSRVCAPADYRVEHGTFSSAGKTVHTDDYEPSAAERLGLAIILHGSGGLDSRNFPYASLAASLAGRGFYVRMPHYFDRVSPRSGKVQTQYPIWVEVVRDAIRDYRERSGAYRRGATLIGFSLGASIALAAASTDPAIAAVVDCAGSMPDEYFSRLDRLPPVFILHNREDPVMPYFNSDQLLRLCKARHWEYQTRIGTGSTHGLPAPETESIDQIVRFAVASRNAAGGGNP